MASDPIEKVGQFCWNELLTGDIEGARAFYSGLFGWEYESMEMGPGMEYHFLKRPGDEEPGGGLVQITDEMGPVPPHWMCYVMVEDCAASLEKAVSLGAEVIKPASEVGMGTFGIIKDPQGAVLSLWQPKADS